MSLAFVLDENGAARPQQLAKLGRKIVRLLFVQELVAAKPSFDRGHADTHTPPRSVGSFARAHGPSFELAEARVNSCSATSLVPRRRVKDLLAMGSPDRRTNAAWRLHFVGSLRAGAHILPRSAGRKQG